MSGSGVNVVRVTFIGGPLHGSEQNLTAPESTIWHTLPDGQIAAYGRRWLASGEQPAKDVSAGLRAVYAPVGMSEHAYRLMAGLVFAAPKIP